MKAVKLVREQGSCASVLVNFTPTLTLIPADFLQDQ